MANHKIPEVDKTLVCERLAEGASLQQAIQGTSIRSKSTAAIIARDKSNEIKQKQENYSELIQSYLENAYIDRARLWGEALGATKKLPVKDFERVSYQGSRDGYITVPDWNTRLKALIYLDKLDGIMPSNHVSLNVMQQFNKNH